MQPGVGNPAARASRPKDFVATNPKTAVTPEELRRRTRLFALRVIALAEALPKGRTADAIARQVVRSAMSVGANYRAACRARSDAEFTAKLCIVVEEADETTYWLELIEESKLSQGAPRSAYGGGERAPRDLRPFPQNDAKLTIAVADRPRRHSVLAQTSRSPPSRP